MKRYKIYENIESKYMKQTYMNYK